MAAPGSRAAAIIALLAAGVFFLSFSSESFAVPSFARQTGLACEGCHTVFPELTPFGRAFKLNGYLIDNLPQVKGITADNKEALLLNWLPPLSIMLQTSYTSTSKALPDPAGGNSQNGQVLLPQQASLFYAGRIAPNMGAFIQATYSSDTGKFGWDNTDIRFADQATVFGKNTTWGISLNNNPTVQDVWNSTPAWQTPFDQRSSAAPKPTAATQIDGKLAGNVAGLTAYGYFANAFYAEFGAYRSAPQGFAGSAGSGPLDSTATNVIQGLAPYWRLAYEHQWDRNSWSIGAFGLDVELLPGGGTPLEGPANKYRDTAFDTQYQYIGDDTIYSVQATYIDEKQTLDASFVSGGSYARKLCIR
jgi:iron:rusticyanin reductase